MTLTNQALFFFTRRGLAIARENVGRRPQVLQKSPAPKALCRSTCNRGKQLEKQQQMKRKKKNKKKNNKKILRTVEERVGMISVWCVGRRKRMMWTLKTGCHVKCVHSLSAYPPIIHTLYHMQTFIAIFVYSSNFHCDAKGWGSRLSVIMTLTVGNLICESPLNTKKKEKKVKKKWKKNKERKEVGKKKKKKAKCLILPM